ncbi:uncharacterized protein I303_106253 [Kwoniella dejecticola CBS 10117]|uniref:Uncharacterized protein n=1 Tax=Kwoniella dejecticola CBS 10117 TaxID=1296121 RepID=A0A1A6A1R2_9TREE|nr:uncharacterized protein I303_06272 [Kwoniella dejecticola CBS 10117]OBR83985.1 hypothetical protein I303_06272 [Kwoniella dejecticola CBS 10117]
MFSAATNSSTSFGSLFLLLLLIGATCITAISLPANGDAATQIQGRASNSSSSSDSGSGSDTDDKRMSKVHINFLDPNIKWQRPYDGSGNYNDTVTSETIDKGWWATFGLGASIGFNLITYYEDPHEIKQNISNGTRSDTA